MAQLTTDDIEARLVELYTERDALDAQLFDGVNHTDFSAFGGVKVWESQLVSNRLAVRAVVTAEIEKWEKVLRASGRPILRSLTTTAPTPPPAGFPDKDDPSFTGSPYAPLWPGRGRPA